MIKNEFLHCENSSVSIERLVMQRIQIHTFSHFYLSFVFLFLQKLHPSKSSRPCPSRVLSPSSSSSSIPSVSSSSSPSRPLSRTSSEDIVQLITSPVSFPDKPIPRTETASSLGSPICFRTVVSDNRVDDPISTLARRGKHEDLTYREMSARDDVCQPNHEKLSRSYWTTPKKNGATDGTSKTMIMDAMYGNGASWCNGLDHSTGNRNGEMEHGNNLNELTSGIT